MEIFQKMIYKKNEKESNQSRHTKWSQLRFIRYEAVEWISLSSYTLNGSDINNARHSFETRRRTENIYIYTLKQLNSHSRVHIRKMQTNDRTYLLLVAQPNNSMVRTLAGVCHFFFLLTNIFMLVRAWFEHCHSIGVLPSFLKRTTHSWTRLHLHTNILYTNTCNNVAANTQAIKGNNLTEASKT